MATNQTTQPTTGSSQTTANSRDIGGEYDVTGTNPDGGEYSGTLLVEKKGEAYRFSWTSGKNSYDGVGVRMENAVTVSFTDGTSGQGCGAAQYWLNSDGTLEGKIGYWGVDNVGTEKATPTGPTTYNVTGTGPDGTAYTAKLTITPEGDGNRFHWSGGRTNEGYGLRFKDVVAVGFGGKLCSWVGYDIEDDGSLRGRWGFSGRSVYGKEFATPRKKVGS
ncbi:MAG: hypothetical protein JO053_05075 [Acidobacteria bacterium]|nr:hypothetical protein [Acidobacteriota bacterium]